MWETLDTSVGLTPKIDEIWDIIAGARSIFILPMISDHKNHQLLKIKNGLRMHQPRHLSEHHAIFKEIPSK